MKRNRADQIVKQVRWGRATSRPFSPSQLPWQASPPPGVTKVLTRDALDKEYRDWYAKWASNFALLNDEFVIEVAIGERNRIRQLEHNEWISLPFVREDYCNIGDDYLWVQDFDEGCTVELCHADADPDVRILSIENMPVLCRSRFWAQWLAFACYPNPPANFVWRSYW
jgi:hypothetical protein